MGGLLFAFGFLFFSLNRAAFPVDVFFLFLLVGLVSGISTVLRRVTHPTDLTAWATGPSRSICSDATRYLATNILRSFHSSIISS